MQPRLDLPRCHSTQVVTAWVVRHLDTDLAVHDLG